MQCRELSIIWSASAMCGLFLLSAMITAHAQFRAGVQGTISDSTARSCPTRRSLLKISETGKIQEANSSDEGFYRITGLAPGKYELTVEKAGYKKAVSRKTSPSVLKIFKASTSFSRSARSQPRLRSPTKLPQQLETENANVNKGITTAEVKRLPQAGRDPYELARLTPGVFGDAGRSPNGNSSGLPNSPGPGGSNNSIFQAENQPQISANGQRISANNFQIDGVSVNSLSHGGAAVVTPNQESVKEIQISSSTLFRRRRQKLRRANQSRFAERHQRFSRQRVPQIQQSEAQCL